MTRREGQLHLTITFQMCRSKLRAIWYVSEVTAQHNKDNSSAIVQCCWFQNASLFDYDLKVRLFLLWLLPVSCCAILTVTYVSVSSIIFLQGL